MDDNGDDEDKEEEKDVDDDNRYLALLITLLPVVLVPFARALWRGAVRRSQVWCFAWISKFSFFIFVFLTVLSSYLP